MVDALVEYTAIVVGVHRFMRAARWSKSGLIVVAEDAVLTDARLIEFEVDVGC